MPSYRKKILQIKSLSIVSLQIGISPTLSRFMRIPTYDTRKNYLNWNNFFERNKPEYM